MEIKELSIELIRPYDKNAKKHPQTQIENVAESIKSFGWQQPIVVDKDYVIIIGHCRFAAAHLLGLSKVPCVVADSLTEDQIKKLRLVDNKTNESDWDFDLLREELGDLDFSDFTFDWGVPEEKKELVEDDFDIDEALNDTPIAQLGDIYKLGDHRLMCGDSTNFENVSALVGDNKIDLLFTDPPYNVNVSNSDGLTIENDNLSDSSFKQLLTMAFACAYSVMKEGAAFYCWYADSEDLNFRHCLIDNGLNVKQCLIWVKNSFNFGRQDYKWQHEPCLYGWKEGAAHYFVEEYNHPTVIEEKIDINKLSKDELKSMLSDFLNSQSATTVIHENKPLKNDLHPTMKPLRMCGELIRHSSKVGDNVLDLFGGSGSTLIVCEQSNRKCFMMEYDPRYVDVIIKRWEEFTGNKAVKL